MNTNKQPDTPEKLTERLDEYCCKTGAFAYVAYPRCELHSETLFDFMQEEITKAIQQAVKDRDAEIREMVVSEHYKLEEWYSSAERPDTISHYKANQKNIETRNAITKHIEGKEVTDHLFHNPCHCGCDGKEMLCAHYDEDCNQCLKTKEEHMFDTEEEMEDYKIRTMNTQHNTEVEEVIENLNNDFMAIIKEFAPNWYGHLVDSDENKGEKFRQKIRHTVTTLLQSNTTAAEERVLEEKKELYEALELMWEQYCPEPFTHKYMTAGENCEYVLDKYKTLTNKDNE